MNVIGFLNSASDDATFARYKEAFRNGLKENGYVDGQNVKVISRWAEGDYAKLPDLTAELVKSGADLIATTGGTVAAQAALKVTKKLPVLFISGFDPAKAGLLKFRNATGVHVATTESVPDRAQALRQLVPKASKVAVLLRPKTFVFEREKELARKAKLMVVEAKTDKDLRPAIEKAIKQGAGALMVAADPYFTDLHKEIIALTRELNLPAAFAWRQYVEAGGLMSLGPDLSEAYSRIGSYAGLILKGIKPEALRVEMPKTENFELVINGNTARALNLEIPSGLRRPVVVI
jgi:putative tryptophan/tyrosine transport system substrate-binding protein